MPDRPFIFDPRLFVTGPVAVCPRCRQQQFGTLGIENNIHTRRCRACRHSAATRLPPVRKKLVYLDQMALSNMAKELDPEWRERVKRRDPFWLELYDQIERIVKLQALACPESPIHMKESSYDTRVEGVLRVLREHLAAGVSFDFPEEILSRQTLHAQQAHLVGTSPDWTEIQRIDVVGGRLDQWMDRVLISVNMGHAESVETRRERRDDLGKTLGEVWSRMQGERRDFEEAFRSELRGTADAAIASVQRDLARQVDWMSGKPLDPLDLIPNSLSRLLTGTAERFAEAGGSDEDSMKRAIEFLYSEHALNSPQNRLSAMLYAAIARRAMMGQKKAPTRGTPNDIDVISSYLPYCDAMFVDDEFAALLREEPLASEVAKYGTRIFSNRNRDEFLDYLRELEAGLDPSHRELVIETYGQSWLSGFRNILELARAREQRAAERASGPQQMEGPRARE
jgi:Zn ribbon nucleic-acid-binding protein